MIYFCIPALNEERTVGVVLWKLRQVMTEMQRDFQIIVVDDASTDATQAVLAPYTRVLPLTLIRNEKQLGYAASMEMALREAVRRSPYPKRDALITLQADFTEDPDCVPTLIKRIEAGADLVAVTPTFDASTPRSLGRAHRFFRWLVRGREWADIGDPFVTPRAYRVLTVKRAIEARGTGRLLTWEGWAANAELLAQALPHSRRNDTIETTVHYKRLQRASRFRFLAMLSQVLGVRAGRTGHAAPVPLPEATIVVPGALAVELATSARREEARRKPPARRTREGGREPRRPGAPGRREEGRREEPRRSRPARPERPPKVVPIAEAGAVAEPAPEKKKRRPRRRSRKPSPKQPPQGTNAETVELVLPVGENAEPAELAVGNETGGNETAEAGQARKKSRRGRRGGRGRRRGPRPADGETNNQAEGMESAAPASDPPPPVEG